VIDDDYDADMMMPWMDERLDVMMIVDDDDDDDDGDDDDDDLTNDC